MDPPQNTIASLSSLGGKGAFVGKVRDDQLGDVFTRDIHAIGVYFNTHSQGVKTPTARSFIFVTPDAERTMQTFLGACVELGPDDIDPELISKSSVTYLEGYLWDPPKAKEAFLKAAQTAYGAGRKVSLSLSDPFCVSRHRDEFLDLITNHVNILFANEEEIKSLYQVESFDEALKQVRGHCDVAALTRGVNGSAIVAGNDVHLVDAEKSTESLIRRAPETHMRQGSCTALQKATICTPVLGSAASLLLRSSVTMGRVRKRTWLSLRQIHWANKCRVVHDGAIGLGVEVR